MAVIGTNTEVGSREAVLEAVRSLDIPKENAIVVGGAAMQVYGIKQTYDIDVVTTPDQLSDVLKLHHKDKRSFSAIRHSKLGHIGVALRVTRLDEGQVTYQPDMYERMQYGGVSFMLAPDDDLYRASYEELLDEANDIAGVLVSPPERILAWKEAVGRPKDHRDAALLRDYLALLVVE
jgi:hypothetical protein